MRKMTKTDSSVKADSLDSVTADVVQIWLRTIEIVEDKKISIAKISKKYGFAAATYYNGRSLVISGKTPRDTDIRIFAAVAAEAEVSLNYLIHGEAHPIKSATDNLSQSCFDNVFALAKGNCYTLFLMTIPYLSQKKLDSIRDDIISRFYK